jgi:hypothetical protein
MVALRWLLVAWLVADYSRVSLVWLVWFAVSHSSILFDRFGILVG